MLKWTCVPSAHPPVPLLSSGGPASPANNSHNITNWLQIFIEQCASLLLFLTHWLHALLNSVDTQPFSALTFYHALQSECSEHINRRSFTVWSHNSRAGNGSSARFLKRSCTPWKKNAYSWTEIKWWDAFQFVMVHKNLYCICHYLPIQDRVFVPAGQRQWKNRLTNLSSSSSAGLSVLLSWLCNREKHYASSFHTTTIPNE